MVVIPRESRRTRPWAISSPSTHCSFGGDRKPQPLGHRDDGRIDADYPPRESNSGPPELPGFSGAVCWMMFSISLPPSPALRVQGH